MKKYLSISYLLVFLSLIFLFNCAYYNTMFNAEKEFKEGIEIIQSEPEKDRHPNANKHFEQTVEKSWKLIEIYGEKSKYADDALFYIVKSEFYLGKYTQARLHLNQFRAKYPKSNFMSEAFLWDGKLFIAEQKMEEARSSLNRCLTESEDSKIRAQAYYELGNLAYEKEDYENAVKVFEKALSEKLDKQYAAFIQYYLGESYFQQEMYEEAIPRFKRVEKFSPSLDIDYKTKFNLAVCYSETGKYSAALEILRKMLTAPRFSNFVPSIKTEIGQINDRRGNLQNAMDMYKEIVREKKSSPGSALASLNLADIYENRLNNIDSAVLYYGKVKRLYTKFDSVDYAERKFKFLSGLKDIKDGIKQDSRLVFRLKNDRYFLDSLYSAQLEDSLEKELAKLTGNTSDSAAIRFADSLKNVLDSLNTKLVDTTTIAYKDSMENIRKNGDDPSADDPFANENNELKTSDPSQSGKTNDPATTSATDQKKLEMRKLPQIEKDLKNNTYHLAEYFLLEVQDYDSALYYYQNFLNVYQDSILTPKALYSISFIHRQADYGDSLRADSLENYLVQNYPDSPFAIKIQTQRGIEIDTSGTDSLQQLADSLFLAAEKLRYSENLDSAIQVYRKVARLDTSMYLSAKSQYVVAWLYERELEETDSAFAAYTLLTEKYPFPEFAKIAKLKISPPKKEVAPVIDSSATATPDSAIILAGGDESQEKGKTIQAGRESENFPVINNRKRYRVWRQRRIKSNNDF